MERRSEGPTDAVVVIGGGMAGLIAAATAAAAGTSRVLLFEPHPLGGRARVDHRNGFAFGRGPRALYVDGVADRTLQALGVDTTAGGAPILEHAGAVDRNAVHLLPQGLISALRSSLMTPLETFAFAKLFARLPRTDPATVTGRTVAEWLDGKGVEGSPRRLVEALIRVATYCDAPDVLDAGAALAGAQAGLSPGVRYLDGGWQSLVDATWAVAERAGATRSRAIVERVETHPTRSGTVLVRTTGGDIEARAAVLATGMPDVAARLLGGTPSSWPVLGPRATVACLELGLRRPPQQRFVLGIDEPTYLSTHAPPAQMAPPGHALVHVMRYQRPGDTASPSEDRHVLDRLAARAGIDPADIVTERFLATMVVTGAMPTAAAGGLAGRVPIDVAEHPGVYLAGDWVGPTGMLLDATASSAAQAGQRAATSASNLVPS